MTDKTADPAALLRAVLDSVTDGVVVFDADDRLVLCNARYRELYAPIADLMVPGTSCEDLYLAWGERGPFDRTHGPVKEQVAQRLVRHRNPQGPFTMRTADRTIRVDERVTANGFVIGVHTDLTEKTRMAAALRETEARLRAFETKKADRFWAMDENLCFTTLVDYPDSQIEDPPENFIGQTRWGAAGIDPDTDPVWGPHRDVLLSRQPFTGFTYDGVGSDGTPYKMSVSGTPVYDDDGNFAGYHGTTTKMPM